MAHRSPPHPQSTAGARPAPPNTAEDDKLAIPASWLRRRSHPSASVPATVAAAAAVLGTTMPDWGDSQRLLHAMLADEQAGHTQVDQKNAVPGSRLLTIGEAANHLGVCRRSLQNWMAAGQLRAIKKGSRYVRIRDCDLSAFVNSLAPRPITRP